MTEKRILVVEDEEAIRSLLEDVFNKLNYTVCSAVSGEEALAILKKEIINVMFLDLALPGINGLELCRKIREENPISIIYALTGNIDLFGLPECRKAGFDDFFMKPVQVEMLLKAAMEAFEKIEKWKNL